MQTDRSTRQWSLPCCWFPIALKGGHKALLLQVLVAQHLQERLHREKSQTLQDAAYTLLGPPAKHPSPQQPRAHSFE